MLRLMKRSWRARPITTAVGGLVAICLAVFVAWAAAPLFYNRQVDEAFPAVAPTAVARAAIPTDVPTAVAQTYGSAGFAAPGTFVLAMVFLVSFVLYYFINWKYLSTLWGLS